jgi:translation initiation factor 1 (eIF-1/SUI1)
MISFEDNTNNNIIEIWSENNGRKTNTYVYGWKLEDIELKEHLKTIKKRRGCNGSIKDIIRDTGKIKVMHLQGNIKDYIIDYLKEHGINDSNIKIKL